MCIRDRAVSLLKLQIFAIHSTSNCGPKILESPLYHHWCQLLSLFQHKYHTSCSCSTGVRLLKRSCPHKKINPIAASLQAVGVTILYDVPHSLENTSIFNSKLASYEDLYTRWCIVSYIISQDVRKCSRRSTGLPKASYCPRLHAIWEPAGYPRPK